MTYTELVKKLIGNISPIGESNTDNERFENLKEMCELVNNLIVEIDNVGYQNNDSHEFSVKRASEFSIDFLTNTLGIKD